MHATSEPRARGATEFEELFGVAAIEVLSAMDAAADDVPEQPPAVALPIDAVGFERRDVLVSIVDPFDAARTATASCRVAMSASVPLSKRGVHVSRMGDALAESAGRAWPGVVDYAVALASEVARRQYGRARVQIDARVPYIIEIPSRPDRRAKHSLEHLDVIVRAQVVPGQQTVDAGLEVTHLVACPCVQQTLKHTLRLAEAAGQAATARSGALRPPLPTHSQRCVTRVLACDLRRALTPTDLLARLERVLVRTSNTLSRDAELACVYRSHARPQFIEDALRDAVGAAGAWASGACAAVEGRARSLESIHSFDLEAEMHVAAAEFAVLAGRGSL